MKLPDYVKVQRGAQPSRGGLKAYTGVIPDYASEVKGLLINDVRPGGPAAKAGIKTVHRKDASRRSKMGHHGIYVESTDAGARPCECRSSVHRIYL